MGSFVSSTEPSARGQGGRVGVLEGFTTQSVGSSDVGAWRAQPREHHWKLWTVPCRTIGKSCTKTGLFALATLLTVDADARTHDQHMVLPNAPHQMRSISIHGQHPPQRDAKVQNRHRKPLETADLLRSKSLLGILNCTTSSRWESIDLGQHRSPPYSKTKPRSLHAQ